MAQPERRPLRMWGNPAPVSDDLYGAVVARLREAAVYWLTTTRSGAQPHPRPMWGVMHEETLFLSAPSTQMRHVRDAPLVTVHVDDGESVVIVEGRASVEHERDAVDEFLRRYNAKYDYELARRAPLVVTPAQILAWTIRGDAAREGFSGGGRWIFS